MFAYANASLSPEGLVDFVVPIALAKDGTPVRRGEASDGSEFVCPGCGGRIGVRGGQGKQVDRHFFHVEGAGSCTAESALHEGAKYLIARKLEEWLCGGPAPRVVRWRRSGRHPR